MIILGVDPSFTCTGWCLIDTDLVEVLDAGEIDCTDKLSITKRIFDICNRLFYVTLPHRVTHFYIESEAFGAKGHVIQLAELTGALKMLYSDSINLSFSPRMARKIVLGKGDIPLDKKKDPKAYCKYIRDNSHGLLSDPKFDHLGPDAMDAYVIALAGYEELTSIPPITDEVLLMRLRDERIITKYKGKYSFGTGKNKITFKNINKLDVNTLEVLVDKYWSLLERT
jgi:Holliday junction resolvasome RuvABC endonuclease subunit